VLGFGNGNLHVKSMQVLFPVFGGGNLHVESI